MTQENEIKRPTQDLEHEPIKQLDNSEKGGKVSQALETVTTTAEKVQRQPVIAHLIRATERFNDRLGNQFGAAITYFSFLSMIPILMVSFAAGGFVLASHPVDAGIKCHRQADKPYSRTLLNGGVDGVFQCGG